MNRADRKAVLTDQRIQERRLAGADTPEHRQVQVPVFDLVEHGLHGLVVMAQRFPDAFGQPLVADEFPQALPREAEVVVAGPLLVSSFFLPGPSW